MDWWKWCTPGPKENRSPPSANGQTSWKAPSYARWCVWTRRVASSPAQAGSSATTRWWRRWKLLRKPSSETWSSQRRCTCNKGKQGSNPFPLRIRTIVRRERKKREKSECTRTLQVDVVCVLPALVPLDRLCAPFIAPFSYVLPCVLAWHLSTRTIPRAGARPPCTRQRRISTAWEWPRWRAAWPRRRSPRLLFRPGCIHVRARKAQQASTPTTCRACAPRWRLRKETARCRPTSRPPPRWPRLAPRTPCTARNLVRQDARKAWTSAVRMFLPLSWPHDAASAPRSSSSRRLLVRFRTSCASHTASFRVLRLPAPSLLPWSSFHVRSTAKHARSGPKHGPSTT
mmetsp:Transcript_10387/g.63365  ORF Transcript_10387/g.63365 Transcript_10387/m.63365 type:complete len:343 (+) Transcript_10387:4584-5612(+)